MTSKKPPPSPRHVPSVIYPEQEHRVLTLEQIEKLGIPLEGELIISLSPALSSRRSRKKSQTDT